MDNFPRFPPHAGDDGEAATIHETVEFLAWICIITAAWVLALLAVGYWIAGAVPSFGAYVHGVLVGVLIGMALILISATRKPRRHDTRRADGIDRTTRGHGSRG